jgi:hypothetical protein
MVHMLERAREVHHANEGGTGRDSLVKCPFCIADEDEAWFKMTRFGFNPPGERPEKMPAPHCNNCPLLSVTDIPIQGLMDDCVTIGRSILQSYREDSDV